MGPATAFERGKLKNHLRGGFARSKNFQCSVLLLGGICARMLCGAASSIRERALFLSSSSPRRYQSSPLSPSDTSLGFELFVNIYKTRARGMSCAVQMVQLSHSGRSVLVFGTIVQPVKGVFGAMPMSDGKNEYMTRKAPIKTAARTSPLARAGLFWRIWANASWESRRPFLTPSAPSLYQTSPPRAMEYPKNCRGATGSWKMTMDATTRRISLSTPERVSTTAEVLPICSN